MEKLRKISKEYYLRQIMACWMVLTMVVVMPVRIAMATTSPGVDAIPTEALNLISAEGASVTGEGPNWLQVTQTDQEAYTAWNNFDIGANSTADFIQPNATAAMLARVNDASGTGIMGHLNANGRLYIINPAGIVFGNGAQVNVGALVASGLDTDIDDLTKFQNALIGDMEFSMSNNGIIVEAGATLTADQSIALIGHDITNNGAIVAPAGMVIMAAGHTVTIGQPGSPTQIVVEAGQLEISDFDRGTLIVEGDSDNDLLNTGTIQADTLVLAAGDIWSQAIENVDKLIAVAYNEFSNPLYIDGVSAQGDITIAARHYIDLGDDTVSGDSLHSVTGDISIKGGPDSSVISASGDIVADTGDVSIVVTHGIDLEGGISAGGNMVLNADSDYYWGDNVSVEGDLVAGGTMEVEGTNVYLNNAESGGDMSIYAHGLYKKENSAPKPDDYVEDVDDLAGGGDVYIEGILVSTGGSIDLEATEFDYWVGDPVYDYVYPGTPGDPGVPYTSDGTMYIGNPDTDPAVDVDAAVDITLHSSTVAVDGTLTLDAGHDVIIDGDVYAYSDGSSDAFAEVVIDAGHDVDINEDIIVVAESIAEGVEPVLAFNATATIDITAGEKVDIDNADVMAEAFTWQGPSADLTATTAIDAGGDVTVTNSLVESEAWTGYGASAGDLTATTTIDAGGEIMIEAIPMIVAGPQGPYGVGAYVHDFPPFVDEVFLMGTSLAGASEPGTVGDMTATTKLKAIDDITVGTATVVYAEAVSGFERSSSSENVSATTDLETCANVIVDGKVEALATIAGFHDVRTSTVTADVIVKAFLDVIVNSEHEEENGILEINNTFGGSNGQILAVASGGLTNTADVTVLAVENVIVNDSSWYSMGGMTVGGPGPFPGGFEEIRADAYNGHTNSAHIGIATRDGDGEGDVIVSGQIGAHTRDTWDIAGQGGSNTSNVEISAARDVIVNGGYALYGLIANPGTTLLESEEGGQILAEAQSGMMMTKGVPTNTAEVEIYAGRDVTVHGAELEYTVLPPGPGPLPMPGFYDGGQILAMTGWSDNSENTSTIGIHAKDDVTINGATITGEPTLPPMLSDSSHGQVLAGAHGNSSIDTAVVVICAQDDVTVDGVVRADAGTGTRGEHQAHIAIAAGDQLGGSSGSIIADADENAGTVDASVMFFVTGLGDIVFNGEAYSTTDHGVTQDPPEIEGPVDCPECDFEWIDWEWCADCEDEELLAPVAPLAQFDIPRIEGCPVETAAAAAELGITNDTIQVAIGNALALNPTVQPCQACAALVDAANILRDQDGSRMAAMLAVFNELAPADAPFTPEMGASIATVFEGAEEGSQYASAMEYIDAFVEYVAVLDAGLGSPVGDSVAFVMDKYGDGISSSDNANIAAYLDGRLGSL